MARERDSQRQKVYDAETRAFGGWLRSESMSVRESQAFVDRVLATKWIENQEDWAGVLATIRRRGGVEIVPSHGGGNASFEPREIGDGSGYGYIRIHRPSIALGVKARQKDVILHELAHLIAPRSAAAHGWQFCDIELRLVRHFLGKEAHDRLKAEFKAGKVRFTKPRAKRQLTPEQREAATARLAAARAARAAKIEEAA